MNKLTIYGIPSTKYDMLKDSVLKLIRSRNLCITVYEVHDTATFVKHGLTTIPAIKFKDSIKCCNHQNLKVYIQKVKQWIINSDTDMYNYTLPDNKSYKCKTAINAESQTLSHLKLN